MHFWTFLLFLDTFPLSRNTFHQKNPIFPLAPLLTLLVRNCRKIIASFLPHGSWLCRRPYSHAGYIWTKHRTRHAGGPPWPFLFRSTYRSPCSPRITENAVLFLHLQASYIVRRQELSLSLVVIAADANESYGRALTGATNCAVHSRAGLRYQVQAYGALVSNADDGI